MPDPSRRPQLRLSGRAWLLSIGAISFMASGGGCKRVQSEASLKVDGERIFRAVCANCHGADGSGGLAAGDDAPRPRNFRDAAFQASRTDAELRQAIVKGAGAMPAFGGAFSEDELDGLVTKLRSFKPVPSSR